MAFQFLSQGLQYKVFGVLLDVFGDGSYGFIMNYWFRGRTARKDSPIFLSVVLNLEKAHCRSEFIQSALPEVTAFIHLTLR